MLYSDNNKKVVENKKDFLYLSRIYAHCSLEDLLGTDILHTDSIELYNDIYNYYHEDDKFIRGHKIIDNNGNITNVKMYLWRDEGIFMWVGLVCLEEDKEGNKDAMIKYKKKNIKDKV